MTKTEEIMELVEYYRLSGVFSDRCKVRSALKSAIEELRAENKGEIAELKAKLATLASQEVAAKYIGTGADGDLIQIYVDIRKGAALFLAAGAVPGDA